MKRSASWYFGLVLALSLPFYLLGVWQMPMPLLPILPASALMAFMPMVAAMILVYRDHRLLGPLSEHLLSPLADLPSFGLADVRYSRPFNPAGTK